MRENITNAIFDLEILLERTSEPEDRVILSFAIDTLKQIADDRTITTHEGNQP